MSASTELRRFLADHASAEARTRLVSATGPTLDAEAFAAAVKTQGYALTESEAATAMETIGWVLAELGDDQLDVVTGGAPMRRHPAYWSP